MNAVESLDGIHGLYYPTCDHGVAEEVLLEDCKYYRKRCTEPGE